MKDYINQFYSEGLATTFYLKPIKYINNKVKNEKLANIFKFLMKLFYTVIVITFAIYIFYIKFPL